MFPSPFIYRVIIYLLAPSQRETKHTANSFAMSDVCVYTRLSYLQWLENHETEFSLLDSWTKICRQFKFWLKSGSKRTISSPSLAGCDMIKRTYFIFCLLAIREWMLHNCSRDSPSGWFSIDGECSGLLASCGSSRIADVSEKHPSEGHFVHNSVETTSGAHLVARGLALLVSSLKR
jgi:hypothetical protein